MGKDKRTFSKARARLSHCLMVPFFLFFLKKNKINQYLELGGRIEGWGGGIIDCFESPV